MTYHDLNPGDKIVHPRYGLGTVQDSVRMTLRGQTRTYLRITLVEGRGRVMIPMEQVAHSDLREVMADLKAIKRVLFSLPELLPDAHRARHATLERRTTTHDPRALAAVLRDLCWREYVSKLSAADRRFRQQVREQLINELKLGMEANASQVQQRLDALVMRAMDHHMAQC